MIMKWDTLWILRIHKLLQKKSILEKADNINRGIQIKKLSQAERAHLQMGNEIDPINLGHLHRIYQNLTATGVEVTVRI